MPIDASPSPLIRNILLFGRVLRSSGVPVSPRALMDLVAALAAVGVDRREDVYNAARCVLLRRRSDGPAFDRAFFLFWRAWTDVGADAGAAAPVLPASGVPQPSGTAEAGEALSGASSVALPGEVDEGEPAGEPHPAATWSAGERLRDRDFASFTEAELADARRFLEAVRWDLTLRRSRRRRPATRGRSPDVRRTLRRSLARGGEFTEIAWRGPKLKRRSLVVLCDISGSMDRYSRLLLHFVHAVERSLGAVEVFVFGTRLTRITPDLRHRDPDTALASVRDTVQDWSGGTRMGEALATFNRVWARRVLDRGAIVLLISDGWDRGDPDELRAEMARLQRGSHRLIWLNPLLGGRDYRPLTRGLQAALPFVDDFLPAHNLASLEAVAALLNEVQSVRPERTVPAVRSIGES